MCQESYKVCADCTLTLPLCDFEKGNVRCKKCRYKRKMESAERRRIPTPETKICTACKSVEPSSMFVKIKGSVDGIGNTCKSCRSHNKKRYYEENKETINEKAKQKYLKLTDSEKLDRSRNNRARQSEEAWLNKKRYSAWWRSQNKEMSRIYSSKRRAKLIKAIPKWANFEEISKIYKQANELSNNCEQYHVDHIVPIQSKLVCGLHCEQNLRIVLASENQIKGNRYWEYMPDNPKETIKELYKGVKNV